MDSCIVCGGDFSPDELDNGVCETCLWNMEDDEPDFEFMDDEELDY